MTERDIASSAQLLRFEDALRARHRAQYGAAQSTVEALMYSLRECGVAALSEPSTQRRLFELSKAQLAEVIARLNRLRPKYPNISDELILMLGEGT
jgi:hypothetical protein